MPPSRRRVFALAAALALEGPAMADDAVFASRQQAMDYLSATLPQATAANPPYRAVRDGATSRWFTRAIHFRNGAAGAVTVTMQETYTQAKDGKTTPGTHQAAFSLADVAVSDFCAPGDVTPDGLPSRGVLFTCKRPGCIAAEWGGKASRADTTDISLQDDAVRAKVLAAFRCLKNGR